MQAAGEAGPGTERGSEGSWVGCVGHSGWGLEECLGAYWTEVGKINQKPSQTHKLGSLKGSREPREGLRAQEGAGSALGFD